LVRSQQQHSVRALDTCNYAELSGRSRSRLFSVFHLFLLLWLSFRFSVFSFSFCVAAETSPPVLGLQFISCRGVNKKGAWKDLVVFVPNQEEGTSLPSAPSNEEEEEEVNVLFLEYGYK
jgi:hypothetical protein